MVKEFGWYKTVEEASAATRALAINSQTDYSQRYKLDPQLPASPRRTYAKTWGGWYKFLGKKKSNYYSTLDEASRAVQSLKITSKRDYARRYKSDPHLPASPQRTYARDWTNWFEFLGGGKKDHYDSVSEASAAAQALGINSKSDYLKRYKLDPRLPASPPRSYFRTWTNWFVFLGKNKQDRYATYTEASKAAQSLKITSKAAYLKRYNLDPHLPVSPRDSYAKDWTNWFEFLGKKKYSKQYPSIVKASAATRSLGITSKTAYRKHHKLDSRLPEFPWKTYADDWIGWDHFFSITKPKIYLTLKEASEATIWLNIHSQRDYRKRYKLDPRLPARPYVVYADNWVSWYDFLGKKKPNFYSTLDKASQVAKELNLRTQHDYNKFYSIDPRLPASPHTVYCKSWTNWYDFLGNDKPKFYPSIEEARNAARALNLTSYNSYKRNYKLDPLLPGNPQIVYQKDWISWFDFLGFERNNLYPTMEEASNSVKKLKIQSRSDYALRHSLDLRLPSCPQTVYAATWPGWIDFLGKSRPEYYKTLNEASSAVRAMKILSRRDYKERFLIDPCLPSSPDKYYADSWRGWPSFLLPVDIITIENFKISCAILGVKNSTQYREKRKEYRQLPANPERSIREWTNWYEALDIPKPYTYRELSTLIRQNGVATLAQYASFRARCNDPRIPVKPEEYYKDKGWTNTYDFWGVKRPYQVKYFTDEWSLWAETIKEFLKSARGGDTKAKDLCEFVREYIEPNGFETSPLEFLTRGSTNIQPMLTLFEEVPLTRRKKWIFSINEFLDWIISNYLILEDTETGEVTHIKGAKNPFSHVNFSGEVAPQVISETNKMALPYQYVKQGREWIFPLDSIEKKLSYRDLAHLHRFSSDWVQIKDSSILDESDPDCVFKVENGKTYLWFPAYWTYTYSLMQLPARGIQIVYCDSGEADKELADFKNGKVIWIKNRTKLAGLTNCQSMVSKSGQGEFGVHYTSNKTKFDGSGYTIPFMPIELAYWLVKLRKWQQRYNPIDEPAKWLDCTRTNLNQVQRKQKGINCFLFREFKEIEPGHFTGRLTDRLAAALFFSAKEETTTATYRGLKYNVVIEDLESSEVIPISPFKSPYTPHSMRVSLINAYAYEFGIPLEVIMKLVGHSNIIMSIYYIKSDKTGANLREKMEVGEKEAMSKATQTLKSFVEQQRIEEVKSQLVGSSVNLLNSLDNARPASSYLWKDFGICPVGGAFCSEGGCPVATKANIYHPVPAGYLGEQNCFQCRFFITGPAFLIGLAAMFNEISLAVHTQSIRYASLGQKLDDIAEKIDVIDHQLYKMKANSSEKSALESDRRELVGERMHLNSEIETRAKKLDLYLSDMNAIHRHIHNCQTLMRNPKENTENQYQLIVPQEFTLGVELDEASSFHQLSEVCSNAELYHSCSDDLAVTRRSQMIDKMMLENGIQPQLFLLSEEEQLLVGNQLTELMLTRLKGWENVDRLMDGSLTLKDLSIDNQFDEKTIRELFEKSKPLKRIG
ncbi:VPA1269 family protein [Vibrio sinaloensis]|uniref:gamma-mobile-trio integrase GmtZ n=1 Tax=Photobacterium sp. (strain ATCC 43367) TaxID=379097 RepID=UPI0022B02CEC|nr:VPA1269 family protein [Vibrio sinaloensis]MCZ4294747.1 VPA1269 family protein [Vibrio sinaloensis]